MSVLAHPYPNPRTLAVRLPGRRPLAHPTPNPRTPALRLPGRRPGRAVRAVSADLNRASARGRITRKRGSCGAYSGYPLRLSRASVATNTRKMCMRQILLYLCNLICSHGQTSCKGPHYGSSGPSRSIRLMNQYAISLSIIPAFYMS